MTVLLANAILTSNNLLINHGIVFDKTILEILPNELLQERYSEIATDLGIGSIIFSGLVNAHVHLEFSANKSTLHYGKFMMWLESVIESRDELINDCHEECITKAIHQMLITGTTAFGAISSYGFDLDSCAKAPQKVVYFNELIGSDPTMADVLYSNFLERLFASQDVNREGFYPAIAIHSPYSVHRVLIQKAINYAQKHSLKLTAHLFESRAERDWLDKNDGEFKPFFEHFLKQTKAANDAKDFLNFFNKIPTLFTHAIHADEENHAQLYNGDHTVIHCPISNRFLGNGRLNINQLDAHNINWVLGTDGLSSNYSLDLFEEMKIALFMHHDQNLNQFAKLLWESVTVKPAKALGLNCGVLAPGYDADLVVSTVDYPINEQIWTHLITQPKCIKNVYIQGESVI